MLNTYNGRITPGEITTSTVDAPENTTCGTFYCDDAADYLWLDGTPMCDRCYEESEYAMLCESCGELSGQTTRHGWECTLCHATWISV